MQTLSLEKLNRRETLRDDHVGRFVELASDWRSIDSAVMATVTSHKTAAESFLKLVCSDVQRAYAEFVGANFRHHNVWFPGNADALKKGMEDNLRQNPGKTLEIKQTIEEGDRVVVMSHVTFKPGDRGYALMHLFRFENGRIAELWDVAQEIPADSPNASGPF